MKKLIKLTLVVALVLGSSYLFAQKLGRINLEEIITLMPEYKEMMTNMEAYSKDLRDNLETIQVELNTKYNDFQKNNATYSEVPRQLKEKELTDLQNRLQEFYQSAQEDLQKKEKELTDPIVAMAQEAVKKVAQKGAYVAVFNTTIPSMVYYDEAAMTDLSTEVKAELGIQLTATHRQQKASASDFEADALFLQKVLSELRKSKFNISFPCRNELRADESS